MFQTPVTIKRTLADIEQRRLVLPAIQRELVWSARQICQLFDSIMQGYPIGALLYWRIERETSRSFKFYDFALNHHQRDRPHCPGPFEHDRSLTGVLDGQQRLTALNVGLRGSLAWKLPRKHWKNPRAFPTRYLHLDLLWRPPDDDETGRKYRFAFRRGLDADWAQDAKPAGRALWFPVRRIMSMDSVPAMVTMLNERLSQQSLDDAFQTLFGLHEIVHVKPVIAYYEERSQDIERVLRIFIRTNSGGTTLSYSDMLLSIATAQWTIDARSEVHGLVDRLNSIGHDGFEFSKDLVLKAALMLADLPDVGFKVRNFKRASAAIIEAAWPDIKKALTLAVQLVANFGFNAKRLRAASAILPIAYYLSRRDPGEAYLTSKHFAHDRERVREWMIRSLLKSGIWGAGLDTLLTATRKAIADDFDGGFPVEKIRQAMAQRGRSMTFEEEEMDELADMAFSDRRIFAMLSLLFPDSPLSGEYDVDHIFPWSGFTSTRLRKAGIAEVNIERLRDIGNRLANLQLLGRQENLEKSNMPPAQWLTEAYSDRVRPLVLANKLMGDVPSSIKGFEQFYDARRAQIRQRIEMLLAVNPPIGDDVRAGAT